MRYQSLALALAVTGFASPVSAADLFPDSRIDSVALFRDGALITRICSFDAPAGASTIALEALPSSADPAALRARFLNEASGALLRNAQLSLPSDPQTAEAVTALERSYQAKQKEIRLREQAIRNAQAEAAFAEKLGESFAERYGQVGEGARLTLDQAQATWEYIEQANSAAQDTILRLETELETLREEAESLQKELAEATERHSQLRAVAEIQIETEEAQQIGLAISYFVPRAGWQPRYELRAEPDQGVVDFSYLAQVWQNTGEPWTNVQLSLHTNQASRSGNAPSLQPLRVERGNGYPASSYGDREEVFELTPFSTSAGKAAPAPPPARVTASAVSFQAQLAGRTTIPSSKDPAAVAIAEASLSAEFWSQAVPRKHLEAYLIGKARNALDLPILPGEGLAFVDGVLSSRVTLEKTLPGEELELSFGLDPMIVVKRIEGAQEDAESGFIDKTLTLRREYANQVTNHHSVEHKIVLVDQFPVSQNAKIEIRRLSPSPDEIVVSEENKDNGLFQWEATLEPQQTRTFKTAYEIIHPRDWRLQPEI